MNVCLFRPSLDKNDGGPARSIPTLAKGLQSIGINVTVLTFETDNMNLHMLDGTGVTINILPRGSSYRYVEKVIIDGNFDIIHIQSIWSIWIHRVAQIARRNHINYMMTPRGTLERWGIYERGFVKKLKKLAALKLFLHKDIQRASCILATAEEEKNSIRNLGFSNPIAVIPNGIEFSDYPCRPKDNLTKVKKQVLFLSRINSQKGVELLLDAWMNISNDFPDWNLLIVGNGELSYINKLKKIIDDSNLESTVAINKPSFGKEKYNLYADSSVFILPTYSENFGMVIAEALSCGLPVITTKNTPWQILENSNSGWWIDLSVESIQCALVDAMTRPPKDLFFMGQNGAKMVREKFNYP